MNAAAESVNGTRWKRWTPFLLQLAERALPSIMKVSSFIRQIISMVLTSFHRQHSVPRKGYIGKKTPATVPLHLRRPRPGFP
jgi:hypothetical protein